MSELKTTIENVRFYNKWRRGEVEEITIMPRDIGMFLESLCLSAETMETQLTAAQSRIAELETRIAELSSRHNK